MYVNQTLKSCLIDFLASTSFRAKEFKDIRKMFVEVYPEFKEKKFYQKIYQIIRDLQVNGFISLDNSTCTYKYTSAYSSSDLAAYLERSNNYLTIQEQLYKEFSRLEGELEKVKLEIEILGKYMRLYPMIVNHISNCVFDARNYLKSIQAEISVVDKLIHCIPKNF